MKIATIVGARTQFIKAALISAAINREAVSGGKIREVLINTGQHYDYNMSRKFFEELNISKPSRSAAFLPRSICTPSMM